ncbi:MAG TPA: DUF2127 domain-containing protein [Verrucomicrobiae bacterium]
MGQSTKSTEPKKRAPTLYLIIGVKIFKGLAAVALALGFYSLTDNNLPEEFRRLLRFIHLDPEKQFFVDLADRVAQITPNNLKWAAAGAVVYASFMLLQAIGLGLRVGWIVWLVIGESAFFVPIEVFELLKHANWWKFAILAVNIMIVFYLYINRSRLIKHHH